jgi:hypothetical protein
MSGADSETDDDERTRGKGRRKRGRGRDEEMEDSAESEQAQAAQQTIDELSERSDSGVSERGATARRGATAESGETDRSGSRRRNRARSAVVRASTLAVQQAVRRGQDEVVTDVEEILDKTYEIVEGDPEE